MLMLTRLEPEERRNPQVANDYRKWFLARLRCEEEALADRQYLCANRFTIADIAIVYVLVLAKNLGIEEAFTPNILRYWNLIAHSDVTLEHHFLNTSIAQTVTTIEPNTATNNLNRVAMTMVVARESL